ncbi:unnamed protein product, partial [Staurois parvus]
MQIGQLQDEEDEGAIIHQEELINRFGNTSLGLNQSHLLKSMGHSRQSSDSSVDRFVTKEELVEPCDLENKPSRIKGDIGHYTDGDAAPLVHCVRLLSASFLLTGQKGDLVPDRDVRVSVKALALSCVGAAVALYPESFFNKLYKLQTDSMDPIDVQYVSDILNYNSHGDPQVRGATSILCGTIVFSILNKSRYDAERWLATVKSCTGNSFSLENCIPLLQKCLKDESSVTCKLTCVAVRHCISNLLCSTYSEHG